MDGSIGIEMVMSGASCLFTSYFWLIKARKERPSLEFFQISDFRANCRRHPELEGTKRLCIQQLDTGGVLVANHSTRQNSIVLFDCILLTDHGAIQGEWGYSGDDKPPWNIGPESTIAFSPACLFDVPEDFEVPENPRFQIQFITASGKRFSHQFTKQTPRRSVGSEPLKAAA